MSPSPNGSKDGPATTTHSHGTAALVRRCSPFRDTPGLPETRPYREHHGYENSRHRPRAILQLRVTRRGSTPGPTAFGAISAVSGGRVSPPTPSRHTASPPTSTGRLLPRNFRGHAVQGDDQNQPSAEALRHAHGLGGDSPTLFETISCVNVCGYHTAEGTGRPSRRPPNDRGRFLRLRRAKSTMT